MKLGYDTVGLIKQSYLGLCEVSVLIGGGNVDDKGVADKPAGN